MKKETKRFFNVIGAMSLLVLAIIYIPYLLFILCNVIQHDTKPYPFWFGWICGAVVFVVISGIIIAIVRLYQFVEDEFFEK